MNGVMTIGADGKFVQSSESFAGSKAVETSSGGLRPSIEVAQDGKVITTTTYQLNIANNNLAGAFVLLFDAWGLVGFNNAAFVPAENLTIANNWLVTGTTNAYSALFLKRVSVGNPFMMTGMQVNQALAPTSLGTPFQLFSTDLKGNISSTPFNAAEAESQGALNNNILPFPGVQGIFDGSKSMAVYIEAGEQLNFTFKYALVSQAYNFVRV